MNQHNDVDLHSEFLRADLFLAMGQPTEAARILEAVVESEPANEAGVAAEPARRGATGAARGGPFGGRVRR